MKRSSSSRVPRRALAPVLLPLSALLLAACASGGGGGGATTASEEEWRSLATPRPTPLPGAARVSVAEAQLLGETTWTTPPGVTPGLAFTELVAAGLLRRSDLQFVERRRFAAAAEAERAGRRARGAPAAGVSPGAELAATVVWVPLATSGGSLEVRLSEVATGRVATTRRVTVPGTPTPVGLARAAVGAIVAALDDLGRLPAWDDPLGERPTEYTAGGVRAEAVASFLAGLEAEERWRWESAREAYQAAARAPGFFEAEAALARTARLRLGGTLGEG